MKLLKLCVVAILAFPLINIPNALASEFEETSETILSIEPGTGTTDPEQPIGPPTGQSGPLSIDAVSIFNFGSVETGGKGLAKTNPAEKLGIQVTDSRGMGAGWSVSVRISDFEESGSGKILRANVSIPEGRISSNLGDMGRAPIAHPLTLNKSPQVIFSAGLDQGMGTFTNEFESNGGHVEIDTNPGALVGNYEATLTWTIQDAPT
ncbi:WxL domain-containing protein (plasmid) [Carnobacterium maltaromaticum]|uniref:WxL domain-containing protein n=1 Tax=Carnobacterium maltaromaticum TaxID=2751 RepID=UPI00344ED0BA